ncbi:hypothetical protein KBB49_00855 [Candidatus Saccharibacteria bacterium]|jgi:hypothetical protein|nr:hypothetical protein [Candidatus Saccharibacteria bacterium]
MEDIKAKLGKLKIFGDTGVGLITKHRFILLFMILGTAIAFALIKTQSFIDIPRNEDRYAEETLKIKYKQIDESTLALFAPTQDDKQVEVNSQFDPTRNNPFTD